ncbi:MAG TPA: M23 family metallopeptidase [Gemmatimonadales bacterium]|jgi:murein DD-endopeptidase MepM/ murein hydrolase activator NlpD|nr:M23 family metallopeptidase [Gemmatimonadales bacterium]
MAKRRWTLVLVPHGSEPSRIVEVSHTVLRAGAVVVGACVVLAGIAGYATISKTSELSRAARLQQENASLSREIGELHGRLVSLSDTITQISQRDARIRVLANLEPIDPQVQEAGIGGPGTSDLSLSGLTGLTRRSAEVRVDLGALIRRANLLASSFKEAADSLSVHTARLAATPSIMPTQGWLSSAFSAMREHPILHLARPHEGIDVSAPMGSPIEAPAAGVVSDAGWETGYGNTVTINHGFGIVTKFAHASKILVKVGQRVSRGQRIALVGNSGLATGPHLHYEVHVNGRPVDPLKYVLPEGVVTD